MKTQNIQKMGSKNNVPTNIGRVTPQSKMIEVNNQWGNTGIKKQQGAMRSLYDSILLTGQTLFEFFKSPNTLLPNNIGTNVDSQNGLLGVGETMAVEWISWQLFQYESATKRVIELTSISASTFASPSFTSGFYAGIFEFYTANDRTLKAVDLARTNPFFNPSQAAGNLLESLELFTDQTIPPLLPWICRVIIPEYATVSTEDWYLRCTVTGTGSILNPRKTY